MYRAERKLKLEQEDEEENALQSARILEEEQEEEKAPKKRRKQRKKKTKLGDSFGVVGMSVLCVWCGRNWGFMDVRKY